MSAVLTARSTAHTERCGCGPSLQRVLYRSAKQQPQRRFHSLYDKVARGDVLRRVWADVRATTALRGWEVHRRRGGRRGRTVP